MKHSEIQRNEREEIRNEIIKLLKINPSYMDEKEAASLEGHIDRILLEPYSSVSRQIESYMNRHHEDMMIDIMDASAASFLDEEIEALRKNAGTLDKELSMMLEFDAMKYRKGTKDEKNQMLSHVFEKLMIAGMILRDYSEVISYLKANQDNAEALKDIGREIKKEQYRIDRKYYSIEAVINKKQMTVLQFSLREGIIHQRTQDRQI
ncbi:hypothetical protein BN3662_01692 [Clostridiales bacterium CHKCI006]|nr:hypothetical protein BN3662_01692 [Clostridiales bacterium CHKCI006]